MLPPYQSLMLAPSTLQRHRPKPIPPQHHTLPPHYRHLLTAARQAMVEELLCIPPSRLQNHQGRTDLPQTL